MRTLWAAGASCIATLALVSCGEAGGAADAGAPTIAMSSGAWTVYDLGDAGANPAMGIAGSVVIKDIATGTNFKLSLTGLAGKNRDFGSHLHMGDCAPPTSGAGHYQHNARPADAGATDPMWANDVNEVWLDFKTDAMGGASSERTSTFKVDLARAKSVIVHANKTADGGVAGTKLACIAVSASK